MRAIVGIGLCVILAGCGSVRNLGDQLGTGLSEGVSANADTIGSRLGGSVVQSARDTLTSPETQERLRRLVQQLGERLAQQVAASRDSLLGDQTRALADSLVNSLIGPHTQFRLGALRDELLNARTMHFLDDSLRKAIADLRDELLGPSTQTALDSVIAKAMTTLSQSYRDKVQPLAREEEGFLKKNITALLFAAGGIVALVMLLSALLQTKRKRERNILDLVTYQIHEMPDQHAYDELVTRVRRKAQELGLEPRLQEILRERGILGKENWTVLKNSAT
jgi:hypothetical protein